MCCCRGGVSSCGGKGGFHLFGFLPWGGGVAMGFGLDMLSVWWLQIWVVFIWVLIYIILMSRIEK